MKLGPLTRYALRLCEDPHELERFLSDVAFARAAMTLAGLSEKLQEIMLSGNQRHVRAALIDESTTFGLTDVDVPTELPGMESHIHLYGALHAATPRNRRAALPPSPRDIRLWIVGTGIRTVVDTAPEARRRIVEADAVFYLLADPLARAWVTSLNASATSLQGLYQVGLSRMITYERIVETVRTSVDSGKRVCFVTAGHPGFFSFAGHMMLETIRDSAMLPAISSQDWSFADLDVDPGDIGLQTYEATFFLRTKPAFDDRSAIMLLQIGAIGVPDVRDSEDVWSADGLRELAGFLAETYGPEHRVAIYDASRYPFTSPTVSWKTLRELQHERDPHEVDLISTLYVPGRPPAGPSDAGTSA